MSYPLPPLQQVDISEYLFEEFCDKWAFAFYERAKYKGCFNGDYDQMWEDFADISPSRFIIYHYKTNLGTEINFFYEGGHEGWTFRVIQIRNDNS